MTTVVAEVLTGTLPSAGITVSDVTGTAHFTVAWIDVSDPDAIWNPVRGADPISISASGFIRDHFPPLNRVIQYGVFAWPDGDQVATSDPITVASTSAWLQDALAPREAVEVITMGWPSAVGQSLLVMGSAAAAVYAQAVEYAQPIGATYPVASIGQRMAAAQVPLEFAHSIAAEGGKLRRLLMGAGQLVLRLPVPDQALDPVASIVVGDATEVRSGNPGSQAQVARWACTATQVRPVTLAFVVPWWTYDQVKALWSANPTTDTYDEIDSARPGATYLDWAKDPEPV